MKTMDTLPEAQFPEAGQPAPESLDTTMPDDAAARALADPMQQGPREPGPADTAAEAAVVPPELGQLTVDHHPLTIRPPEAPLRVDIDDVGATAQTASTEVVATDPPLGPAAPDQPQERTAHEIVAATRVTAETDPETPAADTTSGDIPTGGDEGGEGGDGNGEGGDDTGEQGEEPYGAEVAELFERGIEGTPFAWYGTSIGAVDHLAQHGVLPTTGSLGSDFFYAPEGLDPGNQEGHAAVFAEERARADYMQEQLPPGAVSRGTLKGMIPFEGETEEAIIAEAHSNGVEITAERLRELYYEAGEARGGVLFGISEDLLNEFSEAPGDTDTDRKVDAPGGIPLRYLTGIEPRGGYEFERLEAMQARARRRE